MAAGILLVQEAGGVCTDMKGSPHHLKSPDLLVDNGRIHDEVVDMFSRIFRGEVLHPMPPIS
jgi:fructose-1,6-bisphosphatase/inositol monophosphatase family enzyme